MAHVAADTDQSRKKAGGFPVLGCGVGLRPDHYTHILDQQPRSIDWFEAVSENFMGTGGRPIHILKNIRKNYPIGLHGVSLSIGSTDSLNPQYLKELKELVNIIEPAIISDHICWSSVDGYELHDLLPLPLNEASLDHLLVRIDYLQNYLKRQILLENISTYVTFKESDIPEHEFMTQVAERSGCGLLLDINNIYVNSQNHNFDPRHYISSIPSKYVAQFHIAGHQDQGKFLFDTHEGPITKEVWNLYDHALKEYGQVSSLIEWDTGIPDFNILEDENERARKYYDQYQIMPTNNDEIGFQKIEARNIQKNLEASKNLKVIQLQFKDSILDSQKSNETMLDIFNKQAGDPGHLRLVVYASGYVARTEEALSETYETVKHLVGDSLFQQLAHEYSSSYHSHHYNLSHRGDDFPRFLKNHSIIQELPFLEDLAKFELLKMRTFHAIDKRPFTDFKKLASVAPEKWADAYITFQPSVAHIHSEWPIFDLWNARNTPHNEINLNLVNQAQFVFIFKVKDEVRIETVDSTQYYFLAALRKGRSLGEACELFSDQSETPPLQEWFQAWVSKGLITAIEVRD